MQYAKGINWTPFTSVKQSLDTLEIYKKVLILWLKMLNKWDPECEFRLVKTHSAVGTPPKFKHILYLNRRTSTTMDPKNYVGGRPMPH
jgi:hypothetical protein